MATEAFVDSIESTIRSYIEEKVSSVSGVNILATAACGVCQSFTVPAGGTWLVWGDVHNANSTANGSILRIVSGGTTLDAGWFQTRTNWFAIKIKN